MKLYYSVFFLIILFIFIIFLKKYYWKIQLMYNSGGISLYTPPSFPIIFGKENRVKNMTKIGFNYMKNKTVVIAGLIRNSELNIPEIEKKVESLGLLFSDYRVLLVENDSNDKTRKLLLDWSKRNPKVIILGCGYNKKVCSMGFKPTIGHSVERPRIEKMVYLRNIYLNEIKTNFNNFDYTIVWDLDIIGSVYLDGIANSFGYFNNEKIDAICAYGIYNWGPIKLFYDTYATMEKGDIFNIKNKHSHDIKKGVGLGFKYKRGNEPLQVLSCFSGFTIYKTESILPSYILYGTSSKTEDNLICEHVFLHKKMRDLGFDNIQMNPNMIYLVVNNP